MQNKFLIVNTEVLPGYYEKVVEAEELINSQNLNISEACEQLNISRSTYYKYKNKVFRPEYDYGKKSICAFKMIDEKGVLNRILTVFDDFNINIISINQAAPIRNYAYVTMTIDISKTEGDMQKLLNKLKSVPGLKSVDIIAFE